MLKKHALLISVAYTLTLFTVSLIRLDLNKIEDLVPSFSDKMFHFAAYGLLTCLWFYVIITRFNFTKMKTLLIVTSACIAFGIIIEVLQKELTNTRSFDLYDITANIGGVVIAASIVLLYKKSHVK
ncbi:VanZ like family protein [Bizionia echini]|uniref:VanZ like family protein n=1 Tax=Bizionia echini TaxID=649333 RepID=A0A1I4ZTG4_9FLAO|nr:VanZ family protein [Bizionia echini]MBP94014.1 hypothetical protein [Flavobacteriaceae bacterium]SFN53290.1 VanZ like family protein [Bizionia echini]